jgi:CRP-like cAMP-binding protein
MTFTDALRTHRFTTGLADGHIASLAAIARQVSFAENELILRTGQQSENFYLLLTGSVAVEARARAYTVCIQALVPGDAFGWSALLGHQDTIFQVRARENCTALCIAAPALISLFQQDSTLAAELLRRTLELLAGRVRATEARLGEFCGMRINDSQA